MQCKYLTQGCNSLAEPEHKNCFLAAAFGVFFVNLGEIIAAGSFNDALDLLMHGNVES